jgi:hypothetical protein
MTQPAKETASTRLTGVPHLVCQVSANQFLANTKESPSNAHFALSSRWRSSGSRMLNCFTDRDRFLSDSLIGASCCARNVFGSLPAKIKTGFVTHRSKRNGHEAASLSMGPPSATNSSDAQEDDPVTKQIRVIRLGLGRERQKQRHVDVGLPGLDSPAVGTGKLYRPKVCDC